MSSSKKVAKWKLVVHVLAEPDIIWFKENHPEVLALVVERLKLIASLEDPRKHPDVEPMAGYAEGWYRLAVYEHAFRVVFRLLHQETTEDAWIELWPHETVPQHGNYALQVTRAAYRHVVYKEGLFSRKKKIDVEEI